MYFKIKYGLTLFALWNSKNDGGGKYNSRTKNDIPLIQPMIQLSLKIQPMTQYQVHGFLDFAVKSLVTTNCYNS